jgi:hypothetical protein
MNEVMTIDEMRVNFPDEWVLIADAEYVVPYGVQRGRVVAHSKDRDEVYRVALAQRPNNCAFKYFGFPPEGTTIIL